MNDLNEELKVQQADFPALSEESNALAEGGARWNPARSSDEGEVDRDFGAIREDLSIKQSLDLDVDPIGELKHQQPESLGTAAAVTEIAAELAEYASQRVPLPYVNAEAAIAESFRQQLADGSKTINLSQRYATDDQSAAQTRHEIALQNLQPLIDETAQLAGYKVERGQAIAEGLSQREVPAIYRQQRYSMGV